MGLRFGLLVSSFYPMGLVLSLLTRDEQRALFFDILLGNDPRLMQLTSFLDKKFIKNIISPNFPGTNDCADYPCKNGGTCLDLEKGHVCVCAVGWSGDNCTISKGNNIFPWLTRHFKDQY